MKTLGIYFGPKVISLVETEGTRFIMSINIPRQRLNNVEIEDKVPDEIKIAAAIKDELRKNNIEAKDANLVLLGRDLIIRTFHMPVLPPNELFNAVKFEAKKYIPFRVEELIYDYQLFLDRANRKYLVLFVGVKKDSLDKYLAIFNQLNIKVNTIEYAGFSALRLLQLAKMREKGISAVVTIDLEEDDEVNFVVLENNFPLFSRDIILAAEFSAGEVKLAAADPAQTLEKLKVELRISLDFYLRKFPTKNITSVTLIAPDQYRSELEAFIKERGIIAKFVEAKKLIDKPVSFSLSMLKAYASSIAGVVKSDIKIDLLPTKIKAKAQSHALLGVPSEFNLLAIARNLFIGAVIVGAIYGYYFYRLGPMKANVESVKNNRPEMLSVSPDSSYDDLSNVYKTYSDKIRAITNLVNNRFVVTGELDAIPRLIPNGLWLREFQLHPGDSETLVLTLNGSAYLGDVEREQKLVNKFVNDLKDNEQFKKFFQNNINLVTMDQGQIGKVTVTNFSIECRSK